jgi:hypothetical protein
MTRNGHRCRHQPKEVSDKALVDLYKSGVIVAVESGSSTEEQMLDALQEIQEELGEMRDLMCVLVSCVARDSIGSHLRVNAYKAW